MAAHGLVVVVLGLSTFSSLAPQLAFDLVGSPTAVEEIESFAEFSLTEEASWNDAASETPLVADATPVTAGSLEAPTTAGQVANAGPGPGVAPLGDLAGALAPLPSGLGPKVGAEFFGVRLEGRRICFVLDNSGSMQGGRLETVIAELNRCLAALLPEQRFYVFFYSDNVYPLFYPEPAEDYVAATPAVRARVQQWLDTVELCYGDVVDEALTAAASIQPDAVYLLSDGKIQSQRDLALLLAPGKTFAIHTIGVGLGQNATARAKLDAVAEANAGTFREAEVAEDSRLLAVQQPRPYHREVPGTVWGRRVALRP